MTRLIIHCYLVLLAVAVAIEGHSLFKSDLYLIEATGILRNLPTEQPAKLNSLKQGLALTEQSLTVSSDNPRAHHYHALYLANLGKQLDNNDYLRQSLVELLMVRDSMPLNYLVKQDIAYVMNLFRAQNKKN